MKTTQNSPLLAMPPTKSTFLFQKTVKIYLYIFQELNPLTKYGLMGFLF